MSTPTPRVRRVADYYPDDSVEKTAVHTNNGYVRITIPSWYYFYEIIKFVFICVLVALVSWNLYLTNKHKSH